MDEKKLEENPMINMIGAKIFKVDEENQLVEYYRIKRYNKNSSSLIVIDSKNISRYFRLEELEDFNILRPDGQFMISIASVKQNGHKYKDVIVSIAKVLELWAGMIQPYALCRQSINDIFHNLVAGEETDIMAGLAVNRDDCPANFDMGLMMACDEILQSEYVYFYRTDTLEDILTYIKTRDYDLVLRDLFNTHINNCGDPRARFSNSHMGWCKNLELLLKENNFQADINSMLGITDVDFNIYNEIVEKELPDPSKGNYYTFSDELKLWLSGAFRVPINDITVIEYDTDINLADFNNALYFFLRDNQKKLYLCVYTKQGTWLQSDLKDLYEKTTFSRFKMPFFDKYGNV